MLVIMGLDLSINPYGGLFRLGGFNKYRRIIKAFIHILTPNDILQVLKLFQMAHEMVSLSVPLRLGFMV